MILNVKQSFQEIYTILPQGVQDKINLTNIISNLGSGVLHVHKFFVKSTWPSDFKPSTNFNMSKTVTKIRE